MNKIFATLSLSALAPFAAAQCVSATGTSFGSGDDVVVNAGAGIPLGFSFPIGGVTYDFIHPSSNGFIYLSDGSAAITDSNRFQDAAVMYSAEPRIAVIWKDLNLVAANGGELFVDTSVPNQCTVSWINVVEFGQTAPWSMNCVITSSGQVDMNFTVDALPTTEAITGISPGFGTATAPASVDLSAVLPSIDEMTHELFAVGTFDLSDSLLSLIPTLPGYLPLVSQSGSCATKETFGTGCNSSNDGFLELFDANNPLDIAANGSAISFLRTGNGYTVLDSLPGTFVAPTAAALVVANLDDEYGAVALSAPMPVAGGVTTSALTVCTNGYIALSANQPSIGADFSPTIAEFEAFTEPTICGPWYDWSPNVAGQLVSEEIAGVMYVTWDAVPPYQGTGTDTFQYQFDLTTGNCTIVFDNTSFTGASTWHTPLFGYTSGLAQNALSADLSVDLAAGINVDDVAVVPLSIDSNTPRIGSNWVLTTSGIDPVSPIAITFLSDARLSPAVPMSVAGLDAPGCFIHISSILGDLTAPSAGGTATATLPIPATPGLAGLSLVAQSVCLTLTNNANLLTSNGVEGVIGN
ncbi:MAG: hypothetical protein AB8H80_22930 [Planctomycetota bacterium]